MNNTQLEYFVAIAEEGTICNVAEQKYVSQPAVSTAISNLEHELGHYLFNRSKQGMTLTPFGEKVYVHAKAVIREMDNIQELTREEDESVTIRVAFIPSFAGSIIANVVSRFRQEYPHANVEINERRIGAINGDHTSVKDFSFALTVEINKPTSLSQREKKASSVLGSAGMYAWVNADSPLAKKQVITKEDCKGRMLLAQRGNLEDVRAVLPNESCNDFTSISIPRYLCHDVEAIGFLPGIFGVDFAPLGESCPAVPRKTDFLDRKFIYRAFYDAKRPLSAPEKAFLELVKQETENKIEHTRALAENRA